MFPIILKHSTGKILIFLFTVSVFAFFFAGVSMTQPGFVGVDEATYGSYVDILHKEGVSGIRGWLAEFSASSEKEAPSTPLRILFIGFGAFVCDVSGICGISSLAIVSFLSGILLIILAYLLFEKLSSKEIAFFAGLAVISSPLVLSLSQRALQDTFFTSIIIGTLLAFRAVWNSNSLKSRLVLGSLVVAGFLTKETMILFYPAFVALTAYYGISQKREWKKIILNSIPFVAAPIIYFFLISFVAGGIGEFIAFYSLWIDRVDNVSYVIRFQQGPWFRYFVDLMLVSPVVLILSIIGAVIPLANEKDFPGRKEILIFLIATGFVFCPFSVQNLRMVLFADVLLRLLAIIGALGLSEKIRNLKTRKRVFALIMLAVIVSDISQFSVIFGKHKVYDPVTAQLITANGFIR